ncbi:MAG TPA: flippase [Methanosarcina sp.]|nr:flippase [Methanosarcina sp.]
MNIIRTIVKNATALIIMQITTMFLGLIFSIYLAKYLGVSDFGKYSFALSFTSMLAIIVDVGFNQLTVREISRDKTKLGKFVGNIIPLKIFLSFIYSMIIYLLLDLMKYPYDTKIVVYIFVIFTILNSFGGFFKSIFNAYEIMEYTSFISILEKIIIVSSGVTLLILGRSLIEVVSMYPIAALISIVLCSAILIKKISNFKFELNLPVWRYLFTSSIPFGIFSIFIAINYRIDTVMLSILKDDTTVGLYNAAYTLVLALNFIPASYINSIFPLISRLSVDKNSSLIIAYEKSLKYLLIIAIPLAIGTIILADKLIFLTYGEGFKDSSYALQILIIAVIPIFIHNVLGAIILAINREKDAIPMWAVCATMNITLNYMLIPKYGFVGASITTLISEIVICLQFYHFVNKNFYRISIQKIIFKPLIGGLSMAIFLLFLREINIIILVIAASLVYFATIYKIDIFSEEDLNLLRKIVTRS